MDFITERSGIDAEAIAAREAEIIGKPQRIGEIAEAEMSDEARALVNGIRVSAGAGPAETIPGYFLTMVKHPEIFRCQLDLGTVLFKGKIPARERELAVLRVGWLTRAPYEWGQHVAIAKRYGVSGEEIERVILGHTAEGWSTHDAAILKAVDELLGQQMISDETWTALAKTWDEQQLIEFPMMIGQYVATAYVQNSLRIRLSENNPGLSCR